MACGEVCGKKRERRSKGDRCWWNEEVKKDAHMAMCQNNTEENMWRYRSMKIAVSRAMREKAEEELTE